MERWLISVPAWGMRCVDVFCSAALPALEDAVLEVSGPDDDVRVVVHTDQPERVKHAATRIRTETRPVPAGYRDFDCLSQSHREVMSMACSDDIVVLLTADLVVSRHGLKAVARALSSPQKRLVLCASVRALEGGRIPDTSDGHALMHWAWENRHPITEQSLWPHGTAHDLSRLYFHTEHGVVARMALPHPLAVRVDGRPLRFMPTVDANLMQCFDKTEIHLESSTSDLALIELSPASKEFGHGGMSLMEKFEAGEIIVTDPLQLWCMGHQVGLFTDAVSMAEGDDSRVVDALRMAAR